MLLQKKERLKNLLCYLLLPDRRARRRENIKQRHKKILEERAARKAMVSASHKKTAVVLTVQARTKCGPAFLMH